MNGSFYLLPNYFQMQQVRKGGKMPLGQKQDGWLTLTGLRGKKWRKAQKNDTWNCDTENVQSTEGGGGLTS